MDTSKLMIVGALFIVLLGGGLWIASTNTSEEAMMKEGDIMMEKDDSAMMEGDGAMLKEDDAMIKEEGVMMDGSDALMEKDDSAMTEGEAMSLHGTYEAYTPEKLALAETGDVLLFFHATWCPICRGIESEITADMSKLPKNLHILKVDYDTAVALRQKYGVTVQHTFVQVDSSGKSLTKFSDANSLSAVLAKVQ